MFAAADGIVDQSHQLHDIPAHMCPLDRTVVIKVEELGSEEDALSLHEDVVVMQISVIAAREVNLFYTARQLISQA